MCGKLSSTGRSSESQGIANRARLREACLGLQELLLERSSRTLQSLAELDVKEAQRHRASALHWQARWLA